MRLQAIDILEQYWNYTSFKPLQKEIIDAVLEHEDVFGLLPTGGGKSLCFQVPAMIQDGICIVVSPLIALMKDQVRALNQKGIKALCLSSGISYSDLDALLDNCIYGNYKFLYLSPERLQQELVQDRIKQMPVNLIAVDEAHCISQWGNDFRPAYKNIQVLRQLIPHVNCIALTASANEEVVEDVISELDLFQPKIFKQSFERTNLAYMAYNVEDKNYMLESILKKYSASSIVYVRNRKSTIEISNQLNSKGISATFYHGGLPTKEKDQRQNDWMTNQKQVMVATNAFGMGIDKPDVKTVIHMNLPESLETYFQEAGRAGRNGEKAFAVVLKNNNDIPLLKKQFLSTLPTVDDIKLIYRKLNNYFQIPYGEGEQSTFELNFNQFCHTYQLNGILAYNALQLLDRTSIISLSREFSNKTKIQFLVSNEILFPYMDRHPDLGIPVKTILRTYGGIFEQETKINTLKLAEKASIGENRFIEILKKLEVDGIISLQLKSTDIQVTFIQPREDDKTINRIIPIIQQQNDLKNKQVNDMISYIENDELCKSIQLLSYFGEENLNACGICSVCIKKSSKPPISLEEVNEAILAYLGKKEANSRELLLKIPFQEKELKQSLKALLEQGLITITIKNTYKLNQ
ncbi:RecQ family ATP-dependent DNA helicase [Mangrovimonas futianensis]|uniref:RecQ family ATP-dependent DNA helicase n=1 Tax=Mangrovimonas futianensis TaxID=2895523 RepID=UPI001E575792|nr:ATP-dependent DNA helicase RecQ [Mangrovimonas futianensis]MCF1423180.1 RecQ family ATP-dependent DNA helicase [Mangrovimonas futianensis]